MAQNLYLLIYDVDPAYDVYYYYDHAPKDSSFSGESEYEPSGIDLSDGTVEQRKSSGTLIPSVSSSSPFVIYYSSELAFHYELKLGAGIPPAPSLQYALAYSNNSQTIGMSVNSILYDANVNIESGNGIIARGILNITLSLAGEPINNLFGFNKYANYIFVTWDPPANITPISYNLVYNIAGETDLTQIDNVSSPYILQLPPYTTYEINIYAVYQDGNTFPTIPITISTRMSSVYPLEWLEAYYNEVPLIQQTQTPLKFIGGRSLNTESDRTRLRVIETQTEYVRSNILAAPDIEQYNFKRYEDYVLFKMGRNQRNFALNNL